MATNEDYYISLCHRYLVILTGREEIYWTGSEAVEDTERAEPAHSKMAEKQDMQ